MFKNVKQLRLLLPEDLKKDFGLPSRISENNTGERIGRIENSSDTSLNGSEVYKMGRHRTRHLTVLFQMHRQV